MVELANIVFILDRPRDVVNVGAVVRLMGNFGLRQLRLVEPAAVDPERILTVARRGQAVLASMLRCAALLLSVAACTFGLGPARRVMARELPVVTPRHVAQALR